MVVRVYMTDDGTPEGTAPIAFVNGRRTQGLPGHPHSLRWRYWGIIGEDDQMLDTASNLGRRALQLCGFYVSHQDFGR